MIEAIEDYHDYRLIKQRSQKNYTTDSAQEVLAEVNEN
jgi:hypothetical protein